MKPVTLFLLLLSTALSAQTPYHLDVDGDAQIIGRLDIHHMYDTSTVLVGWNAGKLMNDFIPLRYSTIVGSNAGYNGSIGCDNSFFGESAGYFNSQGDHNSFFGRKSGYKNDFGNGNSFFGEDAGTSNETGDENAFFGRRSGYNQISGDRNVHLGHEAGLRINGDGNVFIGHFAGPNDYDSVTESIDNRLYIHNDSDHDPLIYGEFDNRLLGINTGSPEATVHVGGTGNASSILLNNGGDLKWKTSAGDIKPVLTLHSDDDTYLDAQDDLKFRSGGTSTVRIIVQGDGDVGIGKNNPIYPLDVDGRIRGTEVYCNSTNLCSDVRFKRDFSSIVSPLKILSQLDGYYHFWNQDAHQGWDFPEDRQVGFKAQEVREVLPELVAEMPDGMLAVDYSKMVPVLVEAIKEQQEMITSQANQILALTQFVKKMMPNQLNEADAEVNRSNR